MEVCVVCWKTPDKCKCFVPPCPIVSYETEQLAIKLNVENLPYQEIIDIDDLMYPIINILHTKGYGTSSCCSGHKEEIYIGTYISFDKIYSFPTIPQEFKSRNSNGKFFIEYRLPYSKCKKLSCEKRDNIINKLNKELFEWASKLPNIDGE